MYSVAIKNEICCLQNRKLDLDMHKLVTNTIYWVILICMKWRGWGDSPKMKALTKSIHFFNEYERKNKVQIFQTTFFLKEKFAKCPLCQNCSMYMVILGCAIYPYVYWWYPYILMNIYCIYPNDQLHKELLIESFLIQ